MRIVGIVLLGILLPSSFFQWKGVLVIYLCLRTWSFCLRNIYQFSPSCNLDCSLHFLVTSWVLYEQSLLQKKKRHIPKLLGRVRGSGFNQVWLDNWRPDRKYKPIIFPRYLIWKLQDERRKYNGKKDKEGMRTRDWIEKNIHLKDLKTNWMLSKCSNKPGLLSFFTREKC